MEDRLLSMIYERFLGSDLSDDETAVVREIDDALLWYDLKELLDETINKRPPELHIGLSYNVRPFAEVEKEYISIFKYYVGKQMDRI